MKDIDMATVKANLDVMQGCLDRIRELNASLVPEPVTVEPPPKVRCKFRATSKDSEGNVSLEAVVSGSPENEQFFQYTPAGYLHFSTVNSSAAGTIELGKEYYVDITPAE